MLYVSNRINIGVTKEMSELSEKIIELRIAARRATMCEDDGTFKKNTLSLKTKVLFMISRGAAPKVIMDTLSIVKSNLAAITKSLVLEGFIIKSKNLDDLRNVFYSLTPLGEEHLSEKLSRIDKTYAHLSPSYLDECIKSMDFVIEFLRLTDN